MFNLFSQLSLFATQPFGQINMNVKSDKENTSRNICNLPKCIRKKYTRNMQLYFNPGFT